MSGGNLETRTLLDEIAGSITGKNTFFFDFGHPIVNRVIDSFVKASGIGAIQAVFHETYLNAIEATRINSSEVLPPEIVSSSKRFRSYDLRGENYKKSLEAMVKNVGKEAFQWGLAAGVYSGLTCSLKEARGTLDWKNSAVAGAITGAALALTAEDTSREQVVQFAITGAALSATANFLNGIF